jgi:hypothetical protein
MKKTVLLILLLALSACGGGAGEDAPEVSAPDGFAFTAGAETETAAARGPASAAGDETEAHPNAGGFVMNYNGFNIYMDEDMERVMAKIGEPRHVFEAPSCAFDGIDRIFTYPGIEIRTYPGGERDFVHTVDYKDDSHATPEGIFLGSSLNDVKAAYGTDYEQELGQYRYFRGRTFLSFLVDDGGMVIVITYGLIL